MAEPPAPARWLAFGSILVGGLLGAMIGYGTADLASSGRTLWVGVGLLVGALAGAIGVGVVAGLTLRAMNEWNATSHPEAAAKAEGKDKDKGKGKGKARFELRSSLQRDDKPAHRPRD